MQSLGKQFVETVRRRLVFPANGNNELLTYIDHYSYLTHAGATHDNDTHLANINTLAGAHHFNINSRE